MVSDVAQCDLCRRTLVRRVVRFHIRWPKTYDGPRMHDERIGLDRLTDRPTSGVRAICDDCRRIAAEITTLLEKTDDPNLRQAGEGGVLDEPAG